MAHIKRVDEMIKSINGKAWNAESEWNKKTNEEKDRHYKELLKSVAFALRDNDIKFGSISMEKASVYENGIYYFEMKIPEAGNYKENVVMCYLPSRFTPNLVYGFPFGDDVDISRCSLRDMPFTLEKNCKKDFADMFKSMALTSSNNNMFIAKFSFVGASVR